MYCPKCENEVESTIREVTETYPVKGENITIQAHVRFCNCCGTALWDDDLDEANLLKAFSEYRRMHQLLQPEDIRMIREKYNLSQTAYARVLGFGDKTITRYENGSVADVAQNNLMLLSQSPRIFKYLLERSKEKISAQDYENAQVAIEILRCKVIYSPGVVQTTYSFSNITQIFSADPCYFGDVVNG